MTEHGTVKAYRKGCRCAECRAANTAARRAWQEKVRKRAESGEVEIPHGTVSGYVNWNCRCEDCLEAGRDYHRNWQRTNTRREA